MNAPTDQPTPRFVTCRCQHCDAHIEFDASELEDGDTATVTCPHCQMETTLFIPETSLVSAEPIPPVLEPTLPQTIWFGSEASIIEIGLTSGAIVKIKAVRLYDAAELNNLAAQKAHAAELLNGVSSPYGAIGDPLWVVFATKITAMLEQKHSREAAQKGFALIQKIAERERKLREDVKFFPVGQIQEIENPVASLWRVPSGSSFVHSVHLWRENSAVSHRRWRRPEVAAGSLI